LAARFWLESILPPSRANAVAETVAALGKGYRAIGGSAQLVIDGWAVDGWAVIRQELETQTPTTLNERIGDYASIDEDNPSSVSPSCVRFHKLQRSFHRRIAQFRKFVDRIARDSLNLRLDQLLLVRMGR
jgi:hypothetical protein